MFAASRHDPTAESRTAGPFGSWRALLALLVSVALVGLVVFAIFRTYSDGLSDEFYEMASDSMNDYTLAQQVDVESSIREVESTISAMRVLAESPEIDPQGPTFAAYLETWNEQGSYQITYATLETLEQNLGASGSGEQDARTLEQLRAGRTIVSDVRKSDRLNGYYYSIAEPVEKDGTVVGVLRSIVKAEGLLETSQLSSQVQLLGSLLIKGSDTIVAVSEEMAEYDGMSLSSVLERFGVSSEKTEAVRENIENERDVSTLLLGESDGRMVFLTSARLNVNEWSIVNFTQESALAEHSENIFRATLFTGALLVGISALACLGVALAISALRRRARRNAERYAVLAEFSDTVLFEYSYPRDELELTSNAREVFSLDSLACEGYLKRGIPFIDFHEDDYPQVHAFFEHPNPDNELRTISCRARVLTGEYRWFSFTCRYLYEGSQPFAAVGKIVDITQQREAEEELTRKLQIDGLTKVLNKVTSETTISALLSQHESGLLFVLDVDDFKQVNDAYGHRRGDRALEETARVLLEVFGEDHPVGRIGGDEFVAFSPGVSSEDAIEAYRNSLQERMAEASRSMGVPIGISIGVVRYPQDGATYEELFDAADRAMYEAKNEGRDAGRGLEGGEGRG